MKKKGSSVWHGPFLVSYGQSLVCVGECACVLLRERERACVLGGESEREFMAHALRLLALSRASWGRAGFSLSLSLSLSGRIVKSV